MAKDTTDLNLQYLDASGDQFSAKVRKLLADERAAYEVLKAIKVQVLEAVKAELSMPAGREVKRTAHTRWGQWQIVVGDTVAAKAKSSGPRQSLADYIAAQSVHGDRH